MRYTFIKLAKMKNEERKRISPRVPGLPHMAIQRENICDPSKRQFIKLQLKFVPVIAPNKILKMKAKI